MYPFASIWTFLRDASTFFQDFEIAERPPRALWKETGQGGTLMNPGRRSAVLGPIGRLFRSGTAAGLSDAQLLERFAARHDEAAEAAFAALVERHGPMVLGVCRRVLHDPHDAHD